tara:strand:- start:5761 stop:6045 length:285 start_codon:yes stop_codon:yes gene_type:complete
MSLIYKDKNIKMKFSFNGYPIFRKNFFLLLSERQKKLFTELGSNCYSFIDHKNIKELSITLCNIDFYMETFTFPYRTQLDYKEITSYIGYFFKD